MTAIDEIKKFLDARREAYEIWDNKTDRRGHPCNESYWIGFMDGKDEMLGDLIAIIKKHEG